MPDNNQKNPSIFSKMLEAGTALLDAQIVKAKSTVMNENLEDDFFYAKAVTEDPTYSVTSAGWKEKPGRLMDGHLRQMSMANSVVAAIIQTRQNEVANHSKIVLSEKECGWMLDLRDEEALLEKMKEEILAESNNEDLNDSEDTDQQQENPDALEEQTDDLADIAKKAEGDDGEVNSSIDSSEESETADPNAANKSDDEVETFNFELHRKAKERLQSKFKDAKKKAQDYIINCGLTENRPFDTKKWNFDSALRAIVRDSMTYDRYATEIVPDRAKRPHHWFPVDGATIKYASNNFKNYKQISENFLNLDILYPEQQVKDMQKQKTLELDDKLMANDKYKYVQIIRGKIERAYTEDELKLGVRNANTDIYMNGYGISELELAVSLVTGHLNAEFYNQAYFTQGFSAKGILHIKAAINRRKLETVRQQWQHMLKGARNSFQTPIFAGMEDVAWIPLTQNHNDIGFEGWMRYLIKMICAIYQIDPQEIGIGFKEEGSGGGGSLSGDNTKEKIDHSKNKGLYPLLRHIETFINENILRPYDDRFVIRFTGITAETKEESVKRQDLERKFKKTLNEIREEDGLPPMPGGDEIILGPEFMSWYGQFSPKALEIQKQAADQAAQAAGAQGGDDPFGMDNSSDDDLMNDSNLESNMISPESAEIPGETPVKKSRKIKNKTQRVKIEYYRIGK